mmetsp:Transcript_39912/g.120535  ORF Transcript_39912/g.120535 Transcript_39912/m.120535 type:complete len:233 (+) Transcript_39912:1035-1733(+)
MLPILRVLHDECRLQAAFGRLDGIDPSLVPNDLEFNQGLGQLVVSSRDLLRLATPGQDHGVVVKPSHRVHDAPEEVPRPEDVACDGRHVPYQRRLALVLLVHVLDHAELLAEVVENNTKFRFEVCAQTAVLKDPFELAQKVDGPLCGSDGRKRLIDELLQRALQVRDAYIELHVIPVEAVVQELEEVVLLAAEVLHDGPEGADERMDAVHRFEVHRQHAKLVDCAEHVDELD